MVGFSHKLEKIVKEPSKNNQIPGRSTWRGWLSKAKLLPRLPNLFGFGRGTTATPKHIKNIKNIVEVLSLHQVVSLTSILPVETHNVFTMWGIHGRSVYLLGPIQCHVEVLWKRATPFHHPWLHGIFHEINHPFGFSWQWTIRERWSLGQAWWTVNAQVDRADVCWSSWTIELISSAW